MGPEFAARGYRYLIQACRGTDGSGGSHSYFAEAPDGRATADWIAEQPWFDGRLGSYGASYMGFTQWALASTRPPHLQAMVGRALDLGAEVLVVPGRLARARGDHPVGPRRGAVQQADAAATSSTTSRPRRSSAAWPSCAPGSTTSRSAT